MDALRPGIHSGAVHHQHPRTAAHHVFGSIFCHRLASMAVKNGKKGGVGSIKLQKGYMSVFLCNEVVGTGVSDATAVAG